MAYFTNGSGLTQPNETLVVPLPEGGGGLLLPAKEDIFGEPKIGRGFDPLV